VYTANHKQRVYDLPYKKHNILISLLTFILRFYFYARSLQLEVKRLQKS